MSHRDNDNEYLIRRDSLIQRLKRSIRGLPHEEYEDALSRAYEKCADKYDWPAALSGQYDGWIIKVARRILLNCQRSPRIARSGPLTPELADCASASHDEPDGLSLDLRECFERFPDRTKGFRLELEGYSRNEICRMTGKRHAAVDKGIQRGRTLVRKRLEIPLPRSRKKKS